MEEFTQGLVAGLVLMFALMFFLGSVLEWRQKRSERRPWCERRSRNIYRELPGPDMTEEEANHFGRHLRFYSLPGQRNNAVVGYLTGAHDAETMESKLDCRFSFSDGQYGWRRGKTIAEHEKQMRREAEQRRQEQS